MKAYGVLLPLRHLVNKRSELSCSYSSRALENDFVFRSAYASGAAPTHPYIPRRPAVNVFQGGTLPPLLPPSHPNFSSPTTRSPSPSAPSNSPNPGSRLRLHERNVSVFLPLASFESLVRLSLPVSFFLPSSVSFSRFRWRGTIRDSLCFRN